MTERSDYRLISTDDHIIEPPDVWKGRLEAKFQAKAPCVVEGEEAEYWTFEDTRINNVGLERHPIRGGLPAQRHHLSKLAPDRGREVCGGTARGDTQDRPGQRDSVLRTVEERS